MHLNGAGIRKVAEFIGCFASLIVRWIWVFANNLRNRLADAQETLLKEQLPVLY